MEAARLLGFDDTLVVPDDPKRAHAQLGNCIAPPHAAYALRTAMKALGQTNATHSQMLISKFLPLHDMREYDVWKCAGWQGIKKRESRAAMWHEVLIHVGNKSVIPVSVKSGEVLPDVLKRALPHALMQSVETVRLGPEDTDRQMQMDEKVWTTGLYVNLRDAKLCLKDMPPMKIGWCETVGYMRCFIAQSLFIQERIVQVWTNGVMPDDGTELWMLYGQGTKIWLEDKNESLQAHVLPGNNQQVGLSTETAEKKRKMGVAKDVLKYGGVRAGGDEESSWRSDSAMECDWSQWRDHASEATLHTSESVVNASIVREWQWGNITRSQWVERHAEGTWSPTQGMQSQADQETLALDARWQIATEGSEHTVNALMLPSVYQYVSAWDMTPEELDGHVTPGLQMNVSRPSNEAQALSVTDPGMRDSGIDRPSAALLTLAERSHIAHIAASSQHASVVVDCNVPEERWQEWRLQQICEMGAWIASDEMKYHLGFLRYANPDAGIEMPLVYEDGWLVGQKVLPTREKYKLTVLIDARLLFFHGASETQANCLTDPIRRAIGIDAHPCIVRRDTREGTAHLCGWEVLEQWFQAIGIQTRGVTDYAAILGTLRTDLAVKAIEAMNNTWHDMWTLTTDSNLQERGHGLRARFIFAVGEGLSPDAMIYGGVNKENASRKIANEIAILMLKYGHELTSTTLMAQSLLKAVGREPLEKIVVGERHAVVVQKLKELADQHQVQWPSEGTSVQPKGKGKGAQASGKGKPHFHIKAEDFTIREGTLLNEDLTVAKQLKTFTPGTSGVKLCDPEDAQVWLENPRQLSQDELALAVVTQHCPFGAHGGCNKVQIPVAGNPVLIQVCLHQCGAKQIVVAKEKDAIKVADSSVVAITAYKDEIDPEAWRLIVMSPVKATMDQLGAPDEFKSFLGPPWGRSWQSDKKQVQPQSATSFQVFVRIPMSRLESMIKLSGNGGVYVTPRSDGSAPDTKYAVIWLRGSPLEVVKQASDVPHLGLVRIARRNGQTSMGVRVRRDEFGKHFARLRPGEDVPHVEPVHYLIKLKPVPSGATAQEIGQWISSMKWPARPIKALGQGTWLIGCTDPDFQPEPFALWGDQNILVQRIEQREGKKSTPVLAGKVDRADPLEGPGDPWSAYLSRQGRMPVVSQATSVASSASRVIEAPIEDRFKQQDEKIESLKSSMEEMVGKINENQKQNVAFQNKAQREFGEVRREISQQVTAMTQSFEKTIRDSNPSTRKKEGPTRGLRLFKISWSARKRRHLPTPRQLSRRKWRRTSKLPTLA